MNVSVIIPVKNRAGLLAITLENIFGQTVLPYEIIVVDDDSSDDIGAVMAKYNNKVIFLKNKGTGPGAARNEGLAVATGNFIQFFDSDDLMSTNKIEVQSNLLSATGADFAYGPYVKAIERNAGWERTDAVMQYFPLPHRKLINFVLEGWCPITQSCLFQASLLKEVGPWRTDLMPHEDWEYWFRISKIAKRSVHENQSCVIYRQHGNQITDQAVVSKARSLDALRATELIRASQPRVSSHSRLIFEGRSGHLKRNFLRNFGSSEAIEISFIEKLGLYYFSLTSKADRFFTQSGWQKMHGAIDSDKVFEEYLSKFFLSINKHFN